MWFSINVLIAEIVFTFLCVSALRKTKLDSPDLFFIKLFFMIHIFFMITWCMFNPHLFGGCIG